MPIAIWFRLDASAYTIGMKSVRAIQETTGCVSLAPQFSWYTVNCISLDSVSHLLTHLVVYIIALCSSLNTTTFCIIHVYTVLPHPTGCIL